MADERPAGMVGEVIDLDQGWHTERLDLEPLTAGHAAELAPVLDDAALHEFTGGAPLSPAALTARYARLAERAVSLGAEPEPAKFAVRSRRPTARFAYRQGRCRTR